MSNKAEKSNGGAHRAGEMVAKFSMEIDDEALKQVIRNGQLREFAATAASLASAHISAQIVDRIADMAIGSSAGGVGATFIFDDGDFGTVPPQPRWGVGVISQFDGLQRFTAEQQFG